MKEIVIRVAKDGKINISVSGIKGGSCKDLTKSLEDALGTTEQVQNTGEFYEQVEDENQQSQGSG